MANPALRPEHPFPACSGHQPPLPPQAPGAFLRTLLAALIALAVMLLPASVAAEADRGTLWQMAGQVGTDTSAARG